MSRSRIVLLAAGVALLLALPSLRLGFVPNDYFFLALIEGWYPTVTGQPLNLYASFFDLPGFPWWISPDARAAFWRPLTSALLWLDHALFDRSALFYHLHSLVWLAGLVAACGLLLRRLPRGLMALSLLVLVFDPSQIAAGTWICARHALVSVVPGLLGQAEAETRAMLRWLLPGAAGAMLPAALPLPDERTLLVPSIAFAVVHALMLRAAWRQWRCGPNEGEDRRLRQRLAAGGLILVLGLVHFAMPVARRVLEHVTVLETSASFERIAAGLPLDRRGERQLIAVTGPPYEALHYFPQFLDSQGPPVAACWYQLSGSPHPMELSRTAPQTLELELLEGQMLDSVVTDLLRPADDPTDVGRLWDTPLFQVEVLAADDRGPTRLAFRFERPIDDPDMAFLVWEEERFRPLELPAVGESVSLPAPAGPEDS